MKKCIKIISVLIAVTLLFSSCSANIDISEIVNIFSGKTVFEITEGIAGDGITDVKIFDNTVFILSSAFNEKDESTDYYLCTINAKNAKPIASSKLDGCPIDYPYGLDINENGDIVLYGTRDEDAESEEINDYCVCYNADTFEQTADLKKYTPSLPSIEIEQAPMGLYMNEDESVTGNEYTDIPGQPIRFYYLRSDMDTVILANDLDFSIFSSCGNLAAGLKNNLPGENDETQTILVYDFENSVLVNSLTTMEPTDENMTKYIVSLYLSEKYVLFSEELGNQDSEEYETKYFIWRFRKDALDEPFESTKMTVGEIEEANEKLCGQINKATGINVYINSDKFDFYGEDEDYYLYKDAKPLETNILLTRIKAFIDYLPEGFVKEMYTDLKIFDNYGGFDIFIGSSIKGTASAYASSFMENLTIVFGTDTSDFRTVAHEFMHIMDTRIEDYLGTDVSFYELWGEYNPDGFEYTGYDDENGYFEDEKYDDWFISAYSMSTDAEDRAEIFSYLFIDSFSDEPVPDWYKDKEPLREKTDYLIKMIREAYPSLKDVKTAQWEKIPESYKKQVTFLRCS
ncbi:MAG: hypothetical protein J5877_07155 [Clostridia bacterium]|nr:hypothetical protein [Clostridia bacterium]